MSNKYTLHENKNKHTDYQHSAHVRLYDAQWQQRCTIRQRRIPAVGTTPQEQHQGIGVQPPLLHSRKESPSGRGECEDIVCN